MMTLRFWERIIRGRSLSLAAVFLAVCCVRAGAADLETLARAYRSKPTAANRSALENFAKTHATTEQGALAQLALGQIELELGKESSAIGRFQAARPRLKTLADHIDYGIARCLAALDRKPEAIEKLKDVIGHKPVSPQRSWAILLSAQLYLDTGDPASAVALLRASLPELPASRTLLLYGSALDAAGSPAAAAMQFQTVYYQYPVSAEAAQAGKLLKDLEERLGGGYPPVMPPAMIGRADLLMRGGQQRQAILELNAMMPDLAGEAHDVAQVRIGVARYLANENLTALRYLEELRVDSEEADAERLYYVLACARRLSRETTEDEAIQQLQRQHPDSPWRLRALVAYGNQRLVENDPERYEPLYTACYKSFPDADEAAYCHWKVAWIHYLRRQDDAPALLREHVEQYPDSEKAPASLYFLGREAESRKDFGTARVYYEEILNRYPNYYYSGPARDRLSEAAVGRVPRGASALAEVAKLPPRPSRRPADFAMDQATQVRVDRAKLLESASLTDLAEAELRFGARTDAKREALAVELARTVARGGSADRAIRYIKSFAPGYLSWNLEEAPETFWRLAYPLPYRNSIEKYSRAHELDALVVAGLIRQESEFDPRALSRAKAVGLTQILPATGREISRKLGLRYRSSMLYQPDTNLRMGTYYMRKMLDSLDGKWEAALAAYNAGVTRANQWLTWGDFREPAEFIETIPFTETRNYVQTVLRNADMYKRLYGTGSAGVPSFGGHSTSQAVRPDGAGGGGAGALP